MASRCVDGVRTRAAYPNWQTAAALSFAAQCSSFASSSAADIGSHRQNGQRAWPRISIWTSHAWQIVLVQQTLRTRIDSGPQGS